MTTPADRPKAGRKPLPAGEGKTARVEMRVRPDTKAAWQAKADAAGMTLQAWAERALDRAK
ncbi:MAG: hypothetical protein JNL87_13000 [Burkholderiaceae bacterium]|nr:hypothetical protein [Burkholderiaceae bacterium]